MRTRAHSTIVRGLFVWTIVVMTLIAGRADARDVWTRPAPGVLHLRHVGFPSWHAVIVDLDHPDVAVVGTDEHALALPPGWKPKRRHHGRRRRFRHPGPPPLYHWLRTSSFANAHNAEVAINGNYFDMYHRQFTTCGLTISSGHVWASTYQDARLDCSTSIAFGRGHHAVVFDSASRLHGPAPEPWMSEVISGSPRILSAGQILRYTHPRHAVLPNPRTGIGVSRDGSKLVIVVVEGREGYGVGVTCPELGRIMKTLGAWDALNLDGGGSSALYVRREGGIVSHTGERWERGVGNHLGIVVGSMPTASTPRSQHHRHRHRHRHS